MCIKLFIKIRTFKGQFQIERLDIFIVAVLFGKVPEKSL